MNNIVKPTGRKGNETLNRMRELMNVPLVKEGVDRSVVELAKIGPDGKAYGIVKENSEYFIKVSDKTSNLVAEDFNYIGGLMNKKSQAYHSYSEATKQLNMKFINLAESNEDKIFDILKSDGILLRETTENDGKGTKEDKKTSGDNLATGKNIGVDDFEKAKADGTKDGNKGSHAEKHVMEDVDMTDGESYIDEMLDPVGKEDDDVNNDGEEDDQDDYIKNKRISISKAMNEMDEIIESVTNGKEDKINKFLTSLTESELNNLVKRLKTVNESDDLEKGKFTTWCKGNGFDGPSEACAKKAYSTSDSAKKMAVFYMNTVKPNGKDADSLSETIKKKV